MATNLFNLTATHNKNRWFLPVEPHLCVGPPQIKFLFGGVGLASAIAAMEQTTERPVIWATAQYLSYAQPDEIMDLDVVVPMHGNFVTQARVIGHIDAREILTVNAALGAREGTLTQQWQDMPVVPDPMDCPEVEDIIREKPSLHDHVERRVVKGRFGEARTLTGGAPSDGQVMFWARMRDGVPINSAALAIIADFVPSAIGDALSRHAGANSLDNTLRIRRLVQTEWVLCDVRIHGIHSGFMHGAMHLYSECGELMATASQSGILRFHDEG